MDAKLNTFNKNAAETKNTMKPLNIGTWFHMQSFISVTHMHKLPSFVCHGALWLGEVGDAEGMMLRGRC